jgi:hypothetical protein
MAFASDYVETSYLNWIKGIAMPASPSSIYGSVHSADPTDLGTAADVTASVFGSRLAIASSVWGGISTNGTSRQLSNVIALNYGNAANVSLQALTHLGFWNSLAAGNFFFRLPLTAARSVLSPDNFSLPIGTIAVRAGVGGSFYIADALLNWLVLGNAFPAVNTNLYLGFHNTLDGAGTGTEVTTTIRPSGRIAIASSAWSAVSQSSDISFITNASQISGGSTASASVVGAIGLWDAPTAGNLINFGALDPARTFNIGDPIIINTELLKVSFA